MSVEKRTQYPAQEASMASKVVQLLDNVVGLSDSRLSQFLLTGSPTTLPPRDLVIGKHRVVVTLMVTRQPIENLLSKRGSHMSLHPSLDVPHAEIVINLDQLKSQPQIVENLVNRLKVNNTLPNGVKTPLINFFEKEVSWLQLLDMQKLRPALFKMIQLHELTHLYCELEQERYRYPQDLHRVAMDEVMRIEADVNLPYDKKRSDFMFATKTEMQRLRSFQLVFEEALCYASQLEITDPDALRFMKIEWLLQMSDCLLEGTLQSKFSSQPRNVKDLEHALGGFLVLLDSNRLLYLLNNPDVIEQYPLDLLLEDLASTVGNTSIESIFSSPAVRGACVGRFLQTITSYEDSIKGTLEEARLPLPLLDGQTVAQNAYMSVSDIATYLVEGGFFVDGSRDFRSQTSRYIESIQGERHGSTIRLTANTIDSVQLSLTFPAEISGGRNDLERKPKTFMFEVGGKEYDLAHLNEASPHEMDYVARYLREFLSVFVFFS